LQELRPIQKTLIPGERNMADFTKKLFGLAGAVTMFTGMAFGQLCNTTPSVTLTATPSFIRSEGQTELLPTMSFTCSIAGVAGTANISLYLSPATPITSKVLSGSLTEATATINGGGTPVVGTVIGSSVSFTGVPFTATSTTITITNVRVNASSLPATAAGSLPQSITATAFISGTGVTPATTTGPVVAYATSALGANTGKVYRDQGDVTAGTLVGGANGSTYPVCSSSNTSTTPASNTPNFFVAVNEAFTNAFKSQTDEASQSWISALTGSAPTIAASAAAGILNFPNSGTRIKLVFGNVPAGANLYVGQVVTSAGLNGTTAPTVQVAPGVLTLVASETAPTGAANVTTATTTTGLTGTVGSGATAYGGGLVLLTVSGSTATAIYEVTTDNTGLIDSYSIPVLVSAGSNKVTPGSAAMTVTTSLAPQPATAASIVPSFSSTATSIVTTSTITFASCTTNLLFPFVTNANGFETGVAISNTSKDPFGTTTQQGLCTLSFFQSGVSGATNPTSVTSPNLAEGANQPYLAGETYAFTLTQALGVNTANPATFQGYMIASCNFNFAHGFAYILGGLQPGMFVNPTNTAMGYLAIVLSGRGNVGTPETVTF
jgi:hypothetical protein